MNGYIKKLASDKIIWWGLISSLFLNLLGALYVLLFYRNLPPFLPLYNQTPWGITRLGTKPEVFVPIGITFLILLINVILTNKLYEKMPLVSRMLAITSLLISVLMLIFLFNITRIVL